MSRWRRRALEVFPELRRQLNSPVVFSIYALWFELLPLVFEAHRAGNESLRRRIMEYAEWCVVRRRDQEPSNAAAVAFYEHLFERAALEEWADVVGWMSPEVIQEVWGLWDRDPPLADLDTVRRLVADRHGPEGVPTSMRRGDEARRRSGDCSG